MRKTDWIIPRRMMWHTILAGAAVYGSFVAVVLVAIVASGETTDDDRTNAIFVVIGPIVFTVLFAVTYATSQIDVWRFGTGQARRLAFGPKPFVSCGKRRIGMRLVG